MVRWRGALLAEEPLPHSGAQSASRWVLWVLTEVQRLAFNFKGQVKEGQKRARPVRRSSKAAPLIPAACLIRRKVSAKAPLVVNLPPDHIAKNADGALRTMRARSPLGALSATPHAKDKSIIAISFFAFLS